MTLVSRAVVGLSPRLGRTVVGGFFLVMGGVHLGLASADPQVYDGFAAQSSLGFVRDGWEHVFMAQPRVWALLLMAGEVLLGSLLLAGGRAARVGWVGVLTFHALLMLFGWWAWVYCVPALALLVLLARHDRWGDGGRGPVPVRPSALPVRVRAGEARHS